MFKIFKKKTKKEKLDTLALKLIKNQDLIPEYFNDKLRFVGQACYLAGLMNNILDIIYTHERNAMVSVVECITKTNFFNKYRDSIDRQLVHDILIFQIDKQEYVEYIYLLELDLLTMKDIRDIFGSLYWSMCEEYVLYLFRNVSDELKYYVVYNICENDMTSYVIFNDGMNDIEKTSFVSHMKPFNKYIENEIFVKEYAKYEKNYYKNYLEYFNSGDSTITMESMCKFKPDDSSYMKYKACDEKTSKEYIRLVGIYKYTESQTEDLIEEIFSTDDVICILDLFLEKKIELTHTNYSTIVSQTLKHNRKDVLIYINLKRESNNLTQSSIYDADIAKKIQITGSEMIKQLQVNM